MLESACSAISGVLNQAPALPVPAPAERTLDIILSPVYRTWYGFLSYLPFLAAGIVIILLTWLVSFVFNRFAYRIVSRFHMKPSRRTLLNRMLKLLIWIIGLLIAAMVMLPGLTPTRMVAALGVGSLAAGLAFRDIFENFLAGILILWRFPFENGDFIMVEDITGRVEDVTIRNTLVRRVSGELVMIPNAILFKNPVDILTHWKVRRTTLVVGVAYGEDVDRAREVIAAAMKECHTVDHDRPVRVFAEDFGPSSVNFHLTWWTQPTPMELRQSRDEVLSKVKRSLNEAGIEIPFPYRTLTFKEPLRTIGEEPGR